MNRLCIFVVFCIETTFDEASIHHLLMVSISPCCQQYHSYRWINSDYDLVNVAPSLISVSSPGNPDLSHENPEDRDSNFSICVYTSADPVPRHTRAASGSQSLLPQLIHALLGPSHANIQLPKSDLRYVKKSTQYSSSGGEKKRGKGRGKTYNHLCTDLMCTWRQGWPSYTDWTTYYMGRRNRQSHRSHRSVCRCCYICK